MVKDYSEKLSPSIITVYDCVVQPAYTAHSSHVRVDFGHFTLLQNLALPDSTECFLMLTDIGSFFGEGFAKLTQSPGC